MTNLPMASNADVFNSLMMYDAFGLGRKVGGLSMARPLHMPGMYF